MTKSNFDEMLDSIYRRGANAEWLIFACGCEWNGVQNVWARRCNSGSWCSFLKKRTTQEITAEWKIEADNVAAEEGVGSIADVGAGDPDEAGRVDGPSSAPGPSGEVV